MNRYDLEIVQLQNTLLHFDVKRCRLIADWLAEYIKSQEVDEQLYHVTIKELHLSTRTFNILKNNKITTVGQLMKRSANWDKMRQMKGAGDKVLHEIKTKLAGLRAGNTS